MFVVAAVRHLALQAGHRVRGDVGLWAVKGRDRTACCSEVTGEHFRFDKYMSAAISIYLLCKLFFIWASQLFLAFFVSFVQF